MCSASSTPEIKNRKATHNFQILETLETGIVLKGTEIKSIRQGKLNFTDSHIDITDSGELFLINCHIDEYTEGNRFNHDPLRKRKLLAHQHEILKLRKAKEQKGLTLIPLKLYFKKRRAKILVGTCRGKTGVDKRQDLLKRTTKRETERAIKAARI